MWIIFESHWHSIPSTLFSSLTPRRQSTFICDELCQFKIKLTVRWKSSSKTKDLIKKTLKRWRNQWTASSLVTEITFKLNICKVLWKKLHFLSWNCTRVNWKYSNQKHWALELEQREGDLIMIWVTTSEKERWLKDSLLRLFARLCHHLVKRKTDCPAEMCTRQ